MLVPVGKDADSACAFVEAHVVIAGPVDCNETTLLVVVAEAVVLKDGGGPLSFLRLSIILCTKVGNIKQW